MDIENFYRFLLLGETGSLSRAAEQAYLSRQAMADSLAKLEEELGLRLFERHKRRLELTAAGEELLRFLKDWLPRWEAEQKTLANLDKRDHAAIRMGLSYYNLSPAYIERLLQYEAAHEGVKVTFHDYAPQECFALLEQQAIDLVCMLDVGERPGLARVRLPEESTRPLLMMHESHPLAQKREISTADLRGYPMVLSNNSGKPDAILDNYARPFGAIPLYIPVRNEAYSLRVMKERQAVGLSSTRRPNRFEKDGFVTRPLVDYPLDLSCYVYYRPSASPAVREFVEYFVK